MDRRCFLTAAPAAAFAVASKTQAGVTPEPRPAVVPEAQVRALLAGWLESFNADDPALYKAFITAHLPSGLPYIADDEAVRDVSGGLDALRSELTGPSEISLWVKDRNWDRFSRVILSVESPTQLSDITFRGAPPPAGFAVPRLDEREALQSFDGKLRANGFSGAVSVARGGRTQLQKGYGLADVARNTAAAPATRYCIGSMGKMFTAVAILQLAQRGRVKLDGRLSSYLPDYPNADLARRVSIEHLLTHTGGTGDIFGPAYDGRSASNSSSTALIALYGARPVLFEPGSKWSYSNYGYTLLGAVIERVSGQPYARYLRENIFRSLGMGSTSLTADLPRQAAISYSGSVRAGLEPLAPYIGVSAGGGYSTVQDLNAFARGIQHRRLLDEPHTRLLTTGKVDTGNGFWSLGMSVRKRNGVECFGHGGSAPGVNGDLAVYPGTGYVAAVLCNRGYPLAEDAAEYIGFRLPASV